MQSNKGFNIDIAHSGSVSSVEAMQGDGGFRSISVELTERGKPWYPPAGAEVAVAYAHSNGTKGLYNKLPDGRKAVTVRGNTVTAVLVPQMLAAAGEVQAAIVFNNKELDQLTTFPIAITVKKNPFADAPEAADYIRLQWLEDKLDEYLMIAKDSGMFDGIKGDPFTYEDFTPEQLAALTGPQGPAGDNTAALEAAEAANAAAAEANAATSAAQQVVAGIAPAINQLRTDVASKLPKSPVDWEQWTAAEQAAARDRIGAPGPYRHIASLSVDETGSVCVGIDKDENGEAFALKDIRIFCYLAKMKTRSIVAFGLNTKTSSVNSGFNIIKTAYTFNPDVSGIAMQIEITKNTYWRASIVSTVGSEDGNVSYTPGYSIVSHRGASTVRSNEWDFLSSLSICTDCADGFGVGTIFDIWGR